MKTKKRKFETIYREMNYYQQFKDGNDVMKFNCFMGEFRKDAVKSFVGSDDEFNRQYNFYLQSWRWNAQQRDLGKNAHQSSKQFLKEVYENYN